MARRKRGIQRVVPDTSVPSPCIGECGLSRDSLVCVGCFRSQEEIRNWPILNREKKLVALEQLKRRRAVAEIQALPG